MTRSCGQCPQSLLLCWAPVSQTEPEDLGPVLPSQAQPGCVHSTQKSINICLGPDPEETWGPGTAGVRWGRVDQGPRPCRDLGEARPPLRVHMGVGEEQDEASVVWRHLIQLQVNSEERTDSPDKTGPPREHTAGLRVTQCPGTGGHLWLTLPETCPSPPLPHLKLSSET